MKYFRSTAAILAYKALGRPFDDFWVDWAVEMLEAGFDTEHLVIIAGQRGPFNQFQLHDWTEKALVELHLNYSDKNKAIGNYASYLVDSVLDDKISSFKALGILKDICVELDYDKNLYNFYLLYYAKADLQETDYQYYWHGANSDNIDNLIRDYFREWLLDHPIDPKTTTA